MKKHTIQAAALAGLLLGSLVLPGCNEAIAAQSVTGQATGGTSIQFSGETAQVQGTGATASGGTVTITQAGQYVVSGAASSGQIVVQAPDTAKVELVLSGVELRSATTAAISCLAADELVVTLAEGSENLLADAESYVYAEAGADEPDAALFSKADLTVAGSGSLTVEAHYNNGIGTKDDLILNCTSLTVQAVNDAVRGRDSVTVEGGSYQLTAGGDGIQSNNDTAGDKGWIELQDGSFTITAAQDGVQAETELRVLGGSYNVTSGGGQANAEERTAEEPMGGFGGGMGGQPPQGTAPVAPPEGMALPGDTALSQPSTGTGTAASSTAPAASTQEESPAASQSITSEAAEAVMQAEAQAETAEAETDATASTSYKGFKAGQSLTVSGGQFTVDSADDAFHSNGDVLVNGGQMEISSGDDALHADGNLTVGGEAQITIVTCYEGLEGQTVSVEGGVTDITSSDDGVNAASATAGQNQPGAALSECAINISGGVLRVKAGSQTGGDGLDSNGSLTITGGEVLVEIGASPMDGALDCDGEILLNGGSLLATGGLGMLSLPGSASTQPSLLVLLDSLQGQSGTFTLQDMAGNTLLSQTVESAGASLLLSAAGMVDGESYRLEKDGEELFTVLLSGAVTSVDESGSAASTAGLTGMGRGGGQRGGPMTA